MCGLILHLMAEDTSTNEDSPNNRSPLSTMVAPQIFQLPVASAFNGLDPQQKLYAHYMAKYAAL